MDTFIIISPGFPKDVDDTTCLPSLQEFTLSVMKLYPKINVIVLALQYPFEKKEYNWHGATVYSIGGSNKQGLKRLFTLIKAFLVLIKINRKKIILGTLNLSLSDSALVGKYFSTLFRVKNYTWLIGQDAKANNKYVKRAGLSGNDIIAMSYFLKQEFKKNHGTNPFLVIENGINEFTFPSLNTGKRNIDILGVGSLSSLKNYCLFIDVVYEVTRIIPELNCVIIGQGNQETLLKEKVKEMGLERNISFTGLLSHPQVFEYMNDSRIFLHTSLYEGNCTVLMEALYSGCYVLSSQPLSNTSTPNLDALSSKEDFVSKASVLLKDKSAKAERITFNTMDESVKKIMALYNS